MTKQNKERLQRLLEEIGIRSDDARVYLFLLEYPRSKISLVSQSLNINRTTIYLIINRLIKKNLINEAFDGWKKYYEAQNPSVLKELLIQNQSKLEESLPLFDELISKDSPEIIKYYTTKSAIRTLYNSLIQKIQPKTWYYVFTNQADWLEQDEDFFLDFINKRNKMNLNIKMIFCNSQVAMDHLKLQQSQNIEIKVYNNLNPVMTNLIITPGSFVMHNLDKGEYRAVCINDSSTITSFKEIFETLWESL
jgi:sugar-specific transcriptional regulator TrmB